MRNEVKEFWWLQGFNRLQRGILVWYVSIDSKTHGDQVQEFKHLTVFTVKSKNQIILFLDHEYILVCKCKPLLDFCFGPVTLTKSLSFSLEYWLVWNTVLILNEYWQVLNTDNIGILSSFECWQDCNTDKFWILTRLEY